MLQVRTYLGEDDEQSVGHCVSQLRLPIQDQVVLHDLVWIDDVFDVHLGQKIKLTKQCLVQLIPNKVPLVLLRNSSKWEVAQSQFIYTIF